MDIVIVGGFGTETRQLENTLAQALQELGMKASIGIAAGIREMAAYDVHRMPGLVVNGKLVCEGKALSVAEMKKILKKYSEKANVVSKNKK